LGGRPAADVNLPGGGTYAIRNDRTRRASRTSTGLSAKFFAPGLISATVTRDRSRRRRWSELRPSARCDSVRRGNDHRSVL